MGERKVLNKYYPPDYDPRAIPRGKSKKNLRCEVRMMLPMTVQCIKCGEYMYRGKKYAARVEYLEENYLGIKKVRFYGKCCVCSNPFTMKTDPENEDYEVEEGVTRNFEARRIVEQETREAEEERNRLEMGDAMKALEHRTIESKREIDALDDLDALRALSRQAEKVDVNELLESMNQEKTKKPETKPETEEQEEARLMEEFRKRKRRVRRIEEDQSISDDRMKSKCVTESTKRNFTEMNEEHGTTLRIPEVKISIRKRRKGEKEKEKDKSHAVKSSSTSLSESGILGMGYGSSSSSSDSD